MMVAGFFLLWVGVMLDARVPVWTAVSQGCRPVGRPFTITKAEANIVHELGGRPALDRLRELAASVSDADRELLRGGIHIGVVVDEHREEFRRGDFLVRGVQGVDPEAGSVAVGEYIEVGQTVQFHVRDAGSADEDMRIVTDAAMRRDDGLAARAALMFTCNGRGSHLFGTPHHDASLVHDSLATSDFALAGMFCAGEIGPVGGRSFLHGFTASLALFG